MLYLQVVNVSKLLVKWRTVLFALTTALAIVFGMFIPRLNVIMDISYFLPDSSPVKLGLDRVKEEFSDTDLMNNMVYVMFQDVSNADSLSAVLKEVTGGLAPAAVKHNGNYTLFEFRPTLKADIYNCRDAVVNHFGDSATVELGIEKNMPANIVPMLAIGTILVFAVLLIMCASFIEVLLFLICTGIAVALNMGTNILLPAVSFLTNTMCAVLQMILSMDYSIILMNRYRQERQFQADKTSAMRNAIKGSSSAVMSSALTTVVSLLMLVFMKLKVGADLGIVLAKGVAFSMICNFTVLPALAIWFDRAIFATSKKKMLSLPAAALSRFEMKFRVPLSVLFVGLFLVTAYFQSKTPISYAAIWETPISKQFPVDNNFVLLYDNQDEAVVPAMLDSLATDPHVTSCLSYPALMVQGFTASEMAERFGNLSPLITEDLMRIVYYAYAHPERSEKFSLNEVEAIAEDLSAQGLVPAGMDTKTIMAKLAPPPPKPAVQKEPDVPATVTPPPADVPVPADTLVTASDTVAVEKKPEPAPRSKYTYELATSQMTADAMAQLFEVDRSLARTLYRMAGRSRKNGTMSPHEASSFIVTNLLSNKKYASLLSSDQTAQIRDIHRQLDSAVVAGPTPVEEDNPNPYEITIDEVLTQTEPKHDESVAQAVEPVVTTVQEPEPELEEDDEPTPLERLAEMSMSGRKYSSQAMWSALRSAGIKLSRTDMDLLYMYAGSRTDYDPELRMTVGELIGYLDGTLLKEPAFARFVDDDSAEMIAEIQEELVNGAMALHSDKYSLAVVTTNYNFESPETFAFVDKFLGMDEQNLPSEHYLIGESVMYKEFKDDFPTEKLLLTILTIAAIFLIVLATFRTPVIPAMLVISVMSGVYVNVLVSGLLGNPMYFLGYIIVQSILMGATIDYSILLTTFYRNNRLECGVAESLRRAYKSAGHSVMTSGLILTLAPFVMSFMISDRMVVMILRPLSIGALAAILVILFILPGMIIICDRFVAPKGSVKRDHQ